MADKTPRTWCDVADNGVFLGYRFFGFICEEVFLFSYMLGFLVFNKEGITVRVDELWSEDEPL